MEVLGATVSDVTVHRQLDFFCSQAKSSVTVDDVFSDVRPTSTSFSEADAVNHAAMPLTRGRGRSLTTRWPQVRGYIAGLAIEGTWVRNLLTPLRLHNNQ